VNEDGAGGYDMNRNWPADWQPEWIQGGAGPYPLNWPETRAIGDFLLAHPNVAALQSYHNAGGMMAWRLAVTTPAPFSIEVEDICHSSHELAVNLRNAPLRLLPGLESVFLAAAAPLHR
jgi:hypothetical protein